MNDSAVQKNLLAIQEYSKDTRKLLRDCEFQMKQIDVLRNEVNSLKAQIKTLFARI